MVGRRGEDAKKLSLRLPPAFSPLLQGDKCAHIVELLFKKSGKVWVRLGQYFGNWI